MQEAATRQLERADQETLFRVIDAYCGLLLSMKQEQLADQELKTAQSILDDSQNRFQSGLVVESDYLSSQVNSASRQQQLIEARNAVAFARAKLNNALGVPVDSPYAPLEALSEKVFSASTLDEVERSALETRPDLKRVLSEEAAQADGVKLAKAAFGPRVNAFGSWQLDNPTLAQVAEAVTGSSVPNFSLTCFLVAQNGTVKPGKGVAGKSLCVATGVHRRRSARCPQSILRS